MIVVRVQRRSSTAGRGRYLRRRNITVPLCNGHTNRHAMNTEWVAPASQETSELSNLPFLSFLFRLAIFAWLMRMSSFFRANSTIPLSWPSFPSPSAEIEERSRVRAFESSAVWAGCGVFDGDSWRSVSSGASDDVAES